MPTRGAIEALKGDCCQLTRTCWTLYVSSERMGCDTRIMCSSQTRLQQITKLDPKCPEMIPFPAIFREMYTWMNPEVENKVTMVTLQFLDLHNFNNKHGRSQK